MVNLAVCSFAVCGDLERFCRAWLLGASVCVRALWHSLSVLDGIDDVGCRCEVLFGAIELSVVAKRGSLGPVSVHTKACLEPCSDFAKRGSLGPVSVHTKACLDQGLFGAL